MHIQLQIDETLLNEAVKLGQLKTHQETLETALREFVARKQQQQIIKLFGKLDSDVDYDYKTGRKK